MADAKLRIAVLSGKGGTGKTLVSCNLAYIAAPSVYVDCDVEEPNGHFFLRPEVQRDPTVSDVEVLIPTIDNDLCDGCRKCVAFCRFNALAFIKDRPYLFPEICHSCGGCKLVCPLQAIAENRRKIGEVRQYQSQEVQVLSGAMIIGESSGVPVIRRVLAMAEKTSEETVIIDCPPGSACVVMESISVADFCVLVAEPTIFGAHNLRMVHELVCRSNKQFGVVLNKCLDGWNPSEAYCDEHSISVLGRIPYDAMIGQLSSEAKLVSREYPAARQIFREIMANIRKEVAK